MHGYSNAVMKASACKKRMMRVLHQSMPPQASVHVRTLWCVRPMCMASVWSLM